MKRADRPNGRGPGAGHSRRGSSPLDPPRLQGRPIEGFGSLPPEFAPLVAVLILLTCACPARRQGPDVPDLDERTRAVEKRRLQLKNIREVMTRDLERIQTLASEVRSTPTDLFGEPFPLPLFKHVAVECLNAASSSSEEPARPEKTPGTKDELECAPRFTDRLTSKLEAAAPASKSDALSLLRDLDEFQSLRLKLRTRIAKIADIVEANRNFLATRRAQLRKLRQRWRERRPEISRPRWRELQNNFEQLADDLDELERQTDQIEDQARAWPDTVDDANRAMYFTITSDWKRPSEG